MKLKLSQDKDVAILEISEDVSAENVSVLKAGITKILKSGKNRIVLNLVDSVISNDVAKELVKLNTLAKELAGEVVLSGQLDVIKTALKSFATAPVIRCFPTRESAVAAFASSSANAKSAAGGLSHDDLKSKISTLENEIKALQSKVNSSGFNQIKELAKENSFFQQQIDVLDDILKVFRKDVKKPYELEGTSSKIREIEAAIVEFAVKDSLLPKK